MATADSHGIMFHSTLSSSFSEDPSATHVPTLTLPSPAIPLNSSFPLSAPLPEQPSSTLFQHTDPLLPPPVTHPQNPRHLPSQERPTLASVFYPFILSADATSVITESILSTFESSERADLPRGFPYTTRTGILSFAWEFMCGLQGLVMGHLEGQGGNGRYGETWKSI
ncbi:hypothetical protein G7Y79_00007g022740 [Physcia stellaris]|nr:hypothetical protein G7Y79_00007g022740 [Physcia stellaris]